jgi:hypothetical protein
MKRRTVRSAKQRQEYARQLIRAVMDSQQTKMKLSELDESIDGLHPETRAAIAFMLKKTESKAANKKELDGPFLLAAKFMAKKDVRYYLNYIYSDGNTLTASTSHVLIQVNHKCEPGFYDQLGNLVEPPEFCKIPVLAEKSL